MGHLIHHRPADWRCSRQQRFLAVVRALPHVRGPEPADEQTGASTSTCPLELLLSS